VVALIAALCGVLFVRIGARPIEIFDEARSATNAAEMVATGDWLVARFDGQPDLWNTKPPLLLWVQGALLKAGLPVTAAVRLPSAIAVTLTVFVVFLFCHVYLGDTLAGAAAALVLITSQGLIGRHAARTGDYDALLVLFVTVYVLAYFVYLEELAPEGDSRRRGAALVVFWAALLGAVLTKTAAGLIGLPALLAYTAGVRRLTRVLRDPAVYAGAVLIAAPIAAFYVLRERASPGYLTATLHNDLLGRYAEVIEGHVGGPYYYVRKLLSGRFVPWIYLVPLAAATLAPPRRTTEWRLRLYLLAFTATAFVVLQTARTKLEWYDLQLYPPLAILIGVWMVSATRRLMRGGSEGHSQSRWRVPVREVVVLSLAFAIPVVYNLLLFQRDYVSWEATHPNDAQDKYGRFLEHLRTAYGLRRFEVVDEGLYKGTPRAYPNAALRFYATMENVRGGAVTVREPMTAKHTGFVASCDSSAWRATVAGRAVDTLTTWEGCVAAYVRPTSPLPVTTGRRGNGIGSPEPSTSERDDRTVSGSSAHHP